MKVVSKAMLVLMLLSLLAMPATAQTGGNFALSWYTVEAGTTSSGGEFNLISVVGQPDVALTTSGNFVLQGGFLGGSGGAFEVYLPVVLKN